MSNTYCKPAIVDKPTCATCIFLTQRTDERTRCALAIINNHAVHIIRILLIVNICLSLVITIRDGRDLCNSILSFATIV